MFYYDINVQKDISISNPNVEKKPSFLRGGRTFYDKLFSRKRYIDKYDAGGNITFMKEEQILLEPPHYASK
jgi:hypothetical protein